MTLLVRDEADVVDAQLRFHLENGVDFVIATDDRSVDGTTDILRSYERDGRLRLIRRSGDGLEQSAVVSGMARLAATEFGADWVINSDADEFWWPRDGELHEVLASVPRQYGAVRGAGRHFVLRPDGDEPFYERMRWRRKPSGDPSSPYQVGVKTAHRADPSVVVSYGNHNAYGRRLTPLREWLPFEVLHFPLRTRAQVERKVRRLEANRGDVGSSKHQTKAIADLRRDAEAPYANHLVDDDALAAGLADGSLVLDDRLRDALAVARTSAWRPTLDEDVALAAEFGTFLTADSIPRLTWRLDDLRGRLERLWRIPGPAP